MDLILPAIVLVTIGVFIWVIKVMDLFKPVTILVTIGVFIWVIKAMDLILPATVLVTIGVFIWVIKAMDLFKPVTVLVTIGVFIWVTKAMDLILPVIILVILVVVLSWIIFICQACIDCRSEDSTSAANIRELPATVPSFSWGSLPSTIHRRDYGSIRPRPTYRFEVINETIHRPNVTFYATRTEVPQSKLEAVHRTKPEVQDRTPDQKYENERSQAAIYANKRNELFRASKLKQRNQPAKAKKLLKEGKKFEEKMIACNARAAEIIFAKNNPPSKPIDFIDLHGLFVKEAIAKLSQRIILAKSVESSRLTVVVGLGKHSPGEPKLKPAVMQHAKNSNIRYEVDPRNQGCIHLYFEEE